VNPASWLAYPFRALAGFRDRRPPSYTHSGLSLADVRREVKAYFQTFLPRYKGKQLVAGLAGVDCDVRFVVDVEPRPISWDVALRDGCMTRIEESTGRDFDIQYQASWQTFLQVTGAKMRAEEAFFRGKVQIRGSVLKGLKMASLLQSFFTRFPYTADLTRTSYKVDPNGCEETAPVEGIVEERLSIEGRRGPVEARLAYPEEGGVEWHLVLAPPHPFLGATLNNHVFEFLSGRLAARGCLVLRFSYTFGLGDEFDDPEAARAFWSTSDTSDGLGVEDVIDSWEWVRNLRPSQATKTALIGYSYGAQVSIQSLSRIQPDRLILISPVADRIDDGVHRIQVPVLLVTGDSDFATSTEEYERLVSRIPGAVTRVELKDTDHFFRTKTAELSNAVESFLGMDGKPIA